MIFSLSMLAWVGLQAAHGDWGVVVDYLPFLVGLLLIAGVSFIDDIHSLPDSVRLVASSLQWGLCSGTWALCTGICGGLCTWH